MKIIIKESQFKNAMFKFLELQLYPHEVIALGTKLFIWVKNNQQVASIEIGGSSGQKYFNIDYTIVESLIDMFSIDIDIDEDEIVREFLKMKTNEDFIVKSDESIDFDIEDELSAFDDD